MFNILFVEGLLLPTLFFVPMVHFAISWYMLEIERTNLPALLWVTEMGYYLKRIRNGFCFCLELLCGVLNLVWTVTKD